MVVLALHLHVPVRIPFATRCSPSGLWLTLMRTTCSGYRWYDHHQIEPAYCFGHGESFTSFHYSGLHVSTSAVSLTLQNNGSVAGAEVVQLYLSFPSGAGEPPQQLKGFEKVHLEAGESTVVTLGLDARAFSIWMVGTHAWAVVSGTFGVAVGSSSRDHRLVGSVEVRTADGDEHKRDPAAAAADST